MLDGLELTDSEWREFQRIPEQGYSHRAWVDHKIRERAEKSIAHASSLILNEVAGWERGGSYARQKSAMYQGLARRVRALLEPPGSSSEES